jgi:rSAM/selenodomain-associated transferase 2
MRISIVIPTLNESKAIARTVAMVRKGRNIEIIVSDGGSTDRTVELAQSFRIKTLASKPGRAIQMNAGAKEAVGDALLFLHADTRLPDAYDSHIRQALKMPGVVAGAFMLSIDSPAPGLRIIEKLANWRSRALGLPYGDQCIFVKTDAFREAGGFKDMPIMEDFELMRRLKKMGRIEIVPLPAVTSARRWERQGALKMTLINQAVIALYYLGVPIEKIAKWARKGD